MEFYDPTYSESHVEFATKILQLGIITKMWLNAVSLCLQRQHTD